MKAYLDLMQDVVDNGFDKGYSRREKPRPRRIEPGDEDDQFDQGFARLL